MHRQPPKLPSFRILKQYRSTRNPPGHLNLVPFPHSLAPFRPLPLRWSNGEVGSWELAVPDLPGPVIPTACRPDTAAVSATSGRSKDRGLSSGGELQLLGP